ncbi:MAG: DUF4385 domain-containing protein [Ardenticatenaceae bacterium]|nr:DUF4385 domain-containing protein [Ardenticatenaceae bacterium]
MTASPDETVDYRAHPEAYRIGRGETGVLTVEPYKSEILPLWRFKTPEEAAESAVAILERYEDYKNSSDFVGMDMARKFLQMGYTRSRRYARHRSGRKYDDEGHELPDDPDPQKAHSAKIFKAAWDRVRKDEMYQRLKQKHQRLVAKYRNK